MRPDWDEYFLAIATAVSLRGDCRRSKVGAVIVDRARVLVSSGYNGVDQGEPGCLSGACPRGRLDYSERPAGGDYGDCISYHAEQNSVKFAIAAGQSHRLVGSTIYVTREPCDGCQELIGSNLISRAVYPGGELSFTSSTAGPNGRSSSS